MVKKSTDFYVCIEKRRKCVKNALISMYIKKWECVKKELITVYIWKRKEWVKKELITKYSGKYTLHMKTVEKFK